MKDFAAQSECRLAINRETESGERLNRSTATPLSLGKCSQKIGGFASSSFNEFALKLLGLACIAGANMSTREM